MSYFEELWSAGRENEDFTQDPQYIPDVFSVYNNRDQKCYVDPSNSMFSRNIFESQTTEHKNHDHHISEEIKMEKEPPVALEEVNSPIKTPSVGGSLKVLGIGGAGCNAINRMIEDHVEGVEFVAINTDVQVLKNSLARTKIAIGSKITKGLGAGAKPEIGEKSAVESTEEICNILKNTDMVFITAGMGGGTGTGATPIIAQIAKEMGCLVVAVVTLPFGFEGTKRHKAAIEGIDKVKDHVDTLLVISNSRIFEVVEKNTSVRDAFKKIDEVLKQAVQGISGIISETAIINVDFNDVKTVLSNRGEAIMGIGHAKGDGRAIKAAEDALCNPLIENNTFRQAGAMVAKIIGGSDFDMKEFHEAAEAITKFCRPDAEIIMGLDFDENLRDQVRIIIIATDLVRELPAQDPIIELAKEQKSQHSFHSLQDLPEYQNAEKITHQETPTHRYTDQNEPWNMDHSEYNTKKYSSPQSLDERRSIDFSLRKENTNIYNECDPYDGRRSISDVPVMASDLDTPAFLRRKKRILSGSSYQ